jgi:hypothetical protein
MKSIRRLRMLKNLKKIIPISTSLRRKLLIYLLINGLAIQSNMQELKEQTGFPVYRPLWASCYS